jgi:urease accessory protein
MKKIALTHVLAFMFTPLAYAHPGHGFDHGFMPGFMHPLLGWDHLLVMLAVGVLAGKLGGKARWQLPLTFLMMMAIGAMLGAAGISIGGVETAIAASLMAMGLLLILHLPVSRGIQLIFTASFAIMHGIAHGIELNQGSLQTNLSPLIGMLIATAILHAMGYVLGTQQHKLSQWSQSLLAGVMVGFGVSLLLSA